MGLDILRFRWYDFLVGGRIQTKRKLSAFQIWKKNVKIIGTIGNNTFFEKEVVAKKIEFLIVI